MGLKAKLLKGRELELIDPIQQHEANHVTAVKTTIQDLGGKPVAAPKVKFPAGTFSSRAAFPAPIEAHLGMAPVLKAAMPFIAK